MKALIPSGGKRTRLRLFVYAKKFKLWEIIAFFLAILPAVLLGILILKYSVNVPFWDQWDVAPYIIKSYDQGKFTFQELIAQHNESRLFFPRLVFIALAYLTNWDVRYEILVTFLLACFVSFNVYRLSRLTVAASPLKSLLILFISNLLIFAPIQHDNWLWGIQLVVFIPIACITTSILVAYFNFGTRVKFLICICLATISTFSYANGMLCWVVVFPVLALKTWKDLSKDKWLVFAPIAGFIFNATLYFSKYRKPANTPSFVEALLHPKEAVNYFFAFLGSPLGFKNLIVSTIVGIGLVIAFIACCIYLLRFRKNSILWHRTIGWLMIGVYAAISGLITSLGRVGFGVSIALSSKYTTFSLYFIVAIVHLVAIIFEEATIKEKLSKYNQRFLARSALVLALVFLSLYALCWDKALGRMSTWKRELLQGKACLLFINIVQEEKCLSQKIYPSVPDIKRRVNSLNKLGLIKPRLVKSNKILDIEGIRTKTASNYGYGRFESITKPNKNVYVATGWARLPDRGEPADSVVLTYENAHTEATVFAVADTRTRRKDIAKVTKKGAYYMSGWKKSFEASRLPKGLVKIKAWAFDSYTGKAFEIGGAHILKNK